MSDFRLAGHIEILSIQGVDAALNTLRAKLANVPEIVAVSRGFDKVSASARKAKTEVSGLNTGIAVAATSAQDFADKAALALRRFTAFTVAAGLTYGAARAIFGGLKDAAIFERELIKVQQVTNGTAESLSGLRDEIARLGVNLAAPASELTNVATSLSQAGLNVSEVKTLLEGIARTRLAATFGDVSETTEGVIAIMGQFNIPADEIITSLGLINAAAAEYSVESSDLINSVKRAGGAFSVASKGIAEGNNALAQFNALITSVVQTTRQSPEVVATGLRTIIARLQRTGVQDFLKGFNIDLSDSQGNFAGPYEALQRIGQALENVNTRSAEFSQIIEKIGGTRQYSIVVPLVQQFRLQQEILNTQLARQNSLIQESELPLTTLVEKFKILQNTWANFSRDVFNSPVFQFVANQALELANSLVKVLNSLSDIIPLITLLAGAKAANTFYREGVAGVLKSRLLTGHGAPGIIPHKARGGYIPGYGSGDKELIAAEPGEFVIRKRAARVLGSETLDKLNNVDRFKQGGFIGGYALGGQISRYSSDIVDSKSSRKKLFKSDEEVPSRKEEFFVPNFKFTEITKDLTPLLDKYPKYNFNKEQDSFAGGGKIPRKRPQKIPKEQIPKRSSFAVENLLVKPYNLNKLDDPKYPISILRNPSVSQSLQYLENKKEIRLLINPTTGDYYLWDSSKAVHDQIAKELGIDLLKTPRNRFAADFISGDETETSKLKQTIRNVQSRKDFEGNKFAKGGKIPRFFGGKNYIQKNKTGINSSLFQDDIANLKSKKGKLYRAFDDADRAAGPDVSYAGNLKYFEGNLFLSEGVGEINPISHHKNAFRGKFTPKQFYYFPEYFTPGFKSTETTKELKKLLSKYPKSDFVRLKQFEDSRGEIFYKKVPHGEFDKIFNDQKFAMGGYIPGAGSGDRVPIMAEPGEFVIRKRAAQALGDETLEKLNNVDKFRMGGFVNRKKYAGGGFITNLPTYQEGGTVEGKEFNDIRKSFRGIAKNLGVSSDEFNKVANEIRGTATNIVEARKLFQGYVQALQTPNISIIPTQPIVETRKRERILQGGGTSGGKLEVPLTKTAKEEINNQKRLENLKAAGYANARRRRRELSRSFIFEKTLLEETYASFTAEKTQKIQKQQNKVTKKQELEQEFLQRKLISREFQAIPPRGRVREVVDDVPVKGKQIRAFGKFPTEQRLDYLINLRANRLASEASGFGSEEFATRKATEYKGKAPKRIQRQFGLLTEDQIQGYLNTQGGLQTSRKIAPAFKTSIPKHTQKNLFPFGYQHGFYSTVDRDTFKDLKKYEDEGLFETRRKKLFKKLSGFRDGNPNALGEYAGKFGGAINRLGSNPLALGLLSITAQDLLPKLGVGDVGTGVIGGTLGGAAAGSLFGPGATAVGAIAGGLSALIDVQQAKQKQAVDEKLIENSKKLSEAFKDLSTQGLKEIGRLFTQSRQLIIESATIETRTFGEKAVNAFNDIGFSKLISIGVAGGLTSVGVGTFNSVGAAAGGIASLNPAAAIAATPFFTLGAAGTAAAIGLYSLGESLSNIETGYGFSDEQKNIKKFREQGGITSVVADAVYRAGLQEVQDKRRARVIAEQNVEKSATARQIIASIFESGNQTRIDTLLKGSRQDLLKNNELREILLQSVQDRPDLILGNEEGQIANARTQVFPEIQKEIRLRQHMNTSSALFIQAVDNLQNQLIRTTKFFALFDEAIENAASEYDDVFNNALGNFDLNQKFPNPFEHIDILSPREIDISLRKLEDFVNINQNTRFGTRQQLPANLVQTVKSIPILDNFGNVLRDEMNKAFARGVVTSPTGFTKSELAQRLLDSGTGKFANIPNIIKEELITYFDDLPDIEVDKILSGENTNFINEISKLSEPAKEALIAMQNSANNLAEQLQKNANAQAELTTRILAGAQDYQKVLNQRDIFISQFKEEPANANVAIAQDANVIRRLTGGTIDPQEIYNRITALESRRRDLLTQAQRNPGAQVQIQQELGANKAELTALTTALSQLKDSALGLTGINEQLAEVEKRRSKALSLLERDLTTNPRERVKQQASVDLFLQGGFAAVARAGLNQQDLLGGFNARRDELELDRNALRQFEQVFGGKLIQEERAAGIIDPRTAALRERDLFNPERDRLFNQGIEAINRQLDAIDRFGKLLDDAGPILDVQVVNTLISGLNSFQNELKKLSFPEKIDMSVIHNHKIDFSGFPRFEGLDGYFRKIAEEVTDHAINQITYGKEGYKPVKPLGGRQR